MKRWCKVFNGGRMRLARDRKAFTQLQLAKLIGGSQHQIATYENGERSPSTETLAKIARALEVSADYLLELSDVPGAQMSALGSNLLLLLNTLPQSELDKIERVINAMLPPHSG